MECNGCARARGGHEVEAFRRRARICKRLRAWRMDGCARRAVARRAAAGPASRPAGDVAGRGGVRDPAHVARVRSRAIVSSGKLFSSVAEEDTHGSNQRTWDQEDKWWEQNFSSRPYASGRTYDDFRPAYRYGFESGQHHMGRTWKDVESDLRTGWDKFENRPGWRLDLGERQGRGAGRLAPHHRPARS